jgi:hypothetical protein
MQSDRVTKHCLANRDLPLPGPSGRAPRGLETWASNTWKCAIDFACITFFSLKLFAFRLEIWKKKKKKEPSNAKENTEKEL